MFIRLQPQLFCAILCNSILVYHEKRYVDHEESCKEKEGPLQLSSLRRCMHVCVCVCVELFRLVVYVDRYAITILRTHIKAEDEQDS